MCSVQYQMTRARQWSRSFRFNRGYCILPVLLYKCIVFCSIRGAAATDPPGARAGHGLLWMLLHSLLLFVVQQSSGTSWLAGRLLLNEHSRRREPGWVDFLLLLPLLLLPAVTTT